MGYISFLVLHEGVALKVLLINPPDILDVEMEHLISSEPLGLGYIASLLEKNDFDVKIEEMSLMNSEKKIKNKIKHHHPDVVGVTCFTNFRHGAFRTLEIAKEIDSDIKTIIGGSHATLMWKQVMDNQKDIDFIVIGEGEYTTLELIQTLEKDGDIKKVKGICFKNKNKIFMNEQRQLINDLDELPFPARHLMDLSLYSDIGRDNFFDTLETGEKISKMKKSFIMSSRGCPFSCQFCSTSVFWGHRWRGRSPENVVDEMEHLVQRYDIKVFGFNDDTFTVNNDRVIGICKEIINRGLDIKWFANTRSDCNSLNMLVWMKRAGCFEIAHSPESGSQKILNNINKRMTVGEILQSHELFRKSGLPVMVGLMVGNIGENHQTINDTIKFLDKAKPAGVGMNLTTVYPATGLYRVAKNQGFIKDEDWLNPNFLAPVYTVENSIEQLIEWKQKVMTHFYFKLFGLKRIVRYGYENIGSVPSVMVYWMKRTFGKRHQIM